MTASHFSPAVDVIKPNGGMLRVSYGQAAGSPAIMLETFAKAGETDSPKERMAISTAMLWPILQAMADAGVRAIDAAGGKIKPTGWAVVNADIAEAMQGRGKREPSDG